MVFMRSVAHWSISNGAVKFVVDFESSSLGKLTWINLSNSHQFDIYVANYIYIFIMEGTIQHLNFEVEKSRASPSSRAGRGLKSRASLSGCRSWVPTNIIELGDHRVSRDR